MTGTPIDADRWRVPPALPWLKLAGAAVLVLLGLTFGEDVIGWTISAVAAGGLAAWAARDLVAPVRLAADAAGIRIISGYAGTRVLPWERIERVRVDERTRLGLRSETLEIDAGDALHLLGRYDLNAPLADVAERLD
ncbi:MAG TPA: PH domain-containing protein, partial [Micromonosporaceae bacterium]|nr:PH domain-containing protein [Micromonosporaceae bacterium]